MTENLPASNSAMSRVIPMRSNFRRSSQGREVTLVLGMHRSGTSLLANILHILGVDMMDARPHASKKNPSGFWEREDLLAVQDEILALLGVPVGSPTHCLPLPAGWWRSVEIRPLKAKLSELLASHLAKAKRPWGFKDPRTCRLLPLWGEILEELDIAPRFVWAVRHPSESAMSMADKLPSARPMTSAQSEVMWLAYNYDILRYAGRHWPVIVSYDAWFSDALGTARELADALDLIWPGSDDELHAALHALINPEWRHQWAARDRAATRLPLSEETYQGILNLRDYADPGDASEKLAQPMQSLFGAVQPFAKEVRAIREELLDPATRERDHWREMADAAQARANEAEQKFLQASAEMDRMRAERQQFLLKEEARFRDDEARLRAEIAGLRDKLRSEREHFAEVISELRRTAAHSRLETA